MHLQKLPSPPGKTGPVFSVILATFNRGRHIVPTVSSVIGQTFRDFELLIIGDCCTDETAEIVQPFLNNNVLWLNLSKQGGSQSYPNNAGLERARGQYIAYIGHDDVWAPDHLASLHTCFLSDANVDFAISGCLFHGPPGSDLYRVTGIFENDSAKFEHLFPPSSFAHKQAVVETIGVWANPMEISAAVDRHFVLRAAALNMQFRSTGKITAHKFSAAQRYLCYVQPSSSEQQTLLQALTRGEARRLEIAASL
jgi:glycosyltransferase involved in cell wall biosynthesis